MKDVVNISTRNVYTDDYEYAKEVVSKYNSRRNYVKKDGDVILSAKSSHNCAGSVAEIKKHTEEEQYFYLSHEDGKNNNLYVGDEIKFSPTSIFIKERSSFHMKRDKKWLTSWELERSSPKDIFPLN